MSDIFLSYAREDQERVRPIVRHFERQGWKVFWDRHIPPGREWEEYIEQHIEAAQCVVVVWSEHSVNSKWVRIEAAEGESRSILVPVFLDHVTPSLRFRHLHAADLTSWNNDVDHEQFIACIKAISVLVSPSPDKPVVSTFDVTVNSVVPVVAKKTPLPENFVLIRGGQFTMGSPTSEADRDSNETQHEVRLDDFAMCRYQVTLGELRRFAETGGYRTDAEKENSSFVYDGKEWADKKGVNWRHDESGTARTPAEENHPVLHVSWNDAVAYCQWLSEEMGGHFRLPTEAEWEYACRAGTTTPFSTGENLTSWQANYNGDHPYRDFPRGANRGKTVPVDAFKPNGYGLYNMHGNVWEWCYDWYGAEYYEECRKKGMIGNPQGPATGSGRVLRGGSWIINARYCRSAFRYDGSPGHRTGNVGFRLVFVPQFTSSKKPEEKE